MADIKIDIQTNIPDEVNKSTNALKDLKKAYKEAMAEAAGGSEDAAKRAGELKDKMNDLNESVKAFAGGSKFEQFNSIIGNAADKLKNLDFKGVAEDASRLADIAKSMTFKEVISGIKDMGTAIVTLGKAILANPLFLLAAVIVGITAAIYAFVTSESELSKELTKQIDIVKKLSDATQERYEGELKLAKAAHKDTTELEVKKLKAAQHSTDEQIRLLNLLKEENGELTEEQVKDFETLKKSQLSLIYEVASVQIAASTKKSEEYKKAREKSEDDIKMYEERAKKRQEDANTELEKGLKKYKENREKINDALKKSLDEQKRIADEAIKQRDINDAKELDATLKLIEKTKTLEATSDIDKLNLQKERDKAEIDALFEASNHSNAAYQASLDAKLAIDNKYNNDVNEANKAANEKAAAEQKVLDDKAKSKREKQKTDIINTIKDIASSFNEIGGITNKLAGGLTSTMINAFEEISKKGATTIQKITTGLNALNSIVGQISDFNNAKAEESTKKNDIELKNQVDALTSARDLELQKEGLTSDQKIEIENKYAQQKYALELAEFNNNTVIKKKAFEQDKKMKIAQAVISTITGAISAVTGMISAIPGPVGIILGVLAGAAVAAAGAIQIAKIKSQTFDSGTPPSAPALNTGSASSSGADSAQVAPKSSTLFGTAGTKNNLGTTAQSEPIKAYVVESEVTNTQKKVAQFQSSSQL